jgi:hypothetical protein
MGPMPPRSPPPTPHPHTHSRTPIITTNPTSPPPSHPHSCSHALPGLSCCQVAGLDVGWGQQLSMGPDPRFPHRFLLTRSLPPGTYQLKFVIVSGGGAGGGVRRGACPGC